MLPARLQSRADPSAAAHARRQGVRASRSEASTRPEIPRPFAREGGCVPRGWKVPEFGSPRLSVMRTPIVRDADTFLQVEMPASYRWEFSSQKGVSVPNGSLKLACCL